MSTQFFFISLDQIFIELNNFSATYCLTHEKYFSMATWIFQNERNQHVALYMWVEQKWKDEFLAWDPGYYGGLDSIVIPYDKVWLPDTYLYNR